MMTSEERLVRIVNTMIRFHALQEDRAMHSATVSDQWYALDSVFSHTLGKEWYARVKPRLEQQCVSSSSRGPIFLLKERVIVLLDETSDESGSA